ncbi:MAG TPA: oligosaccharide flippase family protein [Longimicrobium sp.]|nr:oligosaccharide flippase family protein [Longimicrobium sp.]
MSAPPAGVQPDSGTEPLALPGGAEGPALLSALARRSLAGGGWALLTLGLGLAAGVARTLVVARLLGAHELGVMGIALLALGTAEALTAIGVDTALVSHPGDPRDDLDPAFTLQLARGVLVCALLWAAAPLVAAFFATPESVPVIRAVSVVALLRGLANPGVALLVKRIEFGRLFWWSVPEVAVGFALAVGVALARRDVWALVAAAVGAQAVATAASYAMMPWRPRLSLRAEAVRRLVHFGKWVGGSRALMFLSLNLDNAVVGRLLGTGALGVYQLAFRIGELGVATFTRAIVQVALPALSQLQGDRGRMRRAFLAMLRVVVAANCAFAAALLLFAHPLVDRLLGPEWLPAVPVLRILAVAMVFRAVVVLTSELFHALRRPRLTFQVNAARLGVMLLSIVPLTHAYGMPGAALSVLLGGLFATFLCLRHARICLDTERIGTLLRNRVSSRQGR